MDHRTVVIYVIALAIASQTAAAIIAFRLITVTGRKTAWVLISVALTLMAVRRVIPLYNLISGTDSAPPDLLFETIGMLLSLAMAAGMAGIKPLFIERIRTEKALRESDERLAALNAELERRVRERTALLQRRTEELELANERLKEVDRVKSAFLDSMNHEFRTPLNSIIGFSSILLNEWTGPVNAEQKQNLESILRSGRHLLNMIADVLDVTQMEAEAIKPAVEEFELYDLLAEAQKAVSAAVRKKGLELRSESCRHRMRTDRQRLLQCVLNMLYNAVKFTDTGRVTVSSRVVASSGDMPEAETAEIVVADTGIGISEENQAKLFKPFSRLITPQRVIIPGTGLGLFLTRKIAREILKGDIFVESEPGAGSRFTLRIPVGLA